jgi:uncharacterized protein Smg (DUF494 family)
MIKPVLQRIGFHPQEINQLLSWIQHLNLFIQTVASIVIKIWKTSRKEVERECSDPFLLHFFAEKREASTFYLRSVQSQISNSKIHIFQKTLD